MGIAAMEKSVLYSDFGYWLESFVKWMLTAATEPMSQTRSSTTISTLVLLALDPGRAILLRIIRIPIGYVGPSVAMRIS